MNLYLKFILSFIFCLISQCYTAQTKSTDIQTIDGKKYYIHKVEKGQSLYAISKLYETDVNSIVGENNDAIDGLKTGQELKILIKSSIVSKPTLSLDTTNYRYHKVQKGETIYAITKKYNIDEQKLKKLNPAIITTIKEGDNLIVGEKKKISSSNTNTLTLVKPISVTSAKSANIVGSIVTLRDTLKNNKPKKTAYTIGLFLPFKLAQLEAINIDELAKAKASFPPSQSLALDFYAGFKKVVDSLNSKDFDIRINLYDVEEKDSAKIEAICKTSEFKQLDVIFGPLYSSVFRTVAKYAKTYNIAAVSPLTQQNKILFNNPLVSKVNLSQYTLIESLADYCSDSLMETSNIMIVNTTAKDQNYINTFKQKYNANLKTHGKTMRDTIITVKGIAGVKSSYIVGKKNVVVLLTNNQVYLQDFITQLYVFSDKKDIVLMGFNSVSGIDNLDQGYLNQLHFHYASAKDIDYTNPVVQQLVKQYQEVYFSDPSDYFFDGYDIASYYLSNLKTQGPEFFFNLDKYNWNGVSSGFKFYRPDAETGFENRAVSIYKYSDYKLQKLGWK